MLIGIINTGRWRIMEPRDRIKEIRKSFGMTQSEFATRLGMKWYKIKDHELGRLKVTDELAQKINRVFGINYRWILVGETPKEKALGEEGITATVDAGPFVDVYDSGIAAILAKLRGKTIPQSQESPAEPARSRVTMDVYIHSPETIAVAVQRANGICELCGNPAPFCRTSDSLPFLEVHPKVPFAEGGRDEPENIMMVCPNCHRKLHYG